MPLLQSLGLQPWACKLAGIYSKAGAMKCCKGTQITAAPNVCRNIPFLTGCRICRNFEAERMNLSNVDNRFSQRHRRQDQSKKQVQ